MQNTQIHTNKLRECSLQMTVFVNMDATAWMPVDGSHPQWWEVGRSGCVYRVQFQRALPSSHHCVCQTGQARSSLSFLLHLYVLPIFSTITTYKWKENYTLKWAPRSHHCHRMTAAHPLPWQPLPYLWEVVFICFVLFTRAGLRLSIFSPAFM